MQYVNIELLRCRSPRRRRHLRDEVDAGREKLKEFAKRWQGVAFRVVTGEARVRDRRCFEELMDLLLTQQERDFVESAFGDPESGEEYTSVEAQRLCGRMVGGLRELMAWEESETMTRAARRSKGEALLALVAILTHEIRRPLNPNAIYAFGPVASRQYAEAIAQDPDTLLKHVRLVERERMKRFKWLVSDGEER